MTDGDPSVPARRASDAERERAAEMLRDAMASGRISVEELDERTQRVFAATTRTELERLVDDVIVPVEDSHPLAAGSPALTANQDRLPVRAGDDGTGRILSIFSGASRKGRWRIAPECKVINVFSGVEIDLSKAELAADYVELRVFSLFAGAEVTIPRGLNVEISDVAILGANDVSVGEERPDPGGPTVRIKLVTILSGATVRRRKPKKLPGGRPTPELGPESGD